MGAPVLAKRNPIDFDSRPTVALVALAGAGWAVSQAFADDLVDSSWPCGSSEVNRLDRGVAGRNLPRVARASDVALAGLVAAPFLLDALDVKRSGGKGFFEDALVMGEAVLVSGALNRKSSP